VPIAVDPAFSPDSGTIALLLAAVSAADGRGSPIVVAHDPDWASLARLASINKLFVLALQGFDKAKIAVPPEFRDAAMAYRHESLRLNSINLATINRIVPALESAGLDFLVFKGPVHQQIVYGDYFVRPSGDVDVLTPRRHYDRAAQVLLELGYEMPEECTSPWWKHFLGEQHFFPPNRSLATVDLHHLTQQPGCPAPRHLADYIDRRTEIALGRIMVPTLPAIDAALLSSISLVKAIVHHEVAASYAMDLKRSLTIMSRLEREALIALARRQGLLNTFRFAVGCTEGLFGAFTGEPDLNPKRLASALPDLTAIMLTPWLPSIRWPKRRQLLWSLCDRSPAIGRLGTYAIETTRALSSEICRRMFEPRKLKTPLDPTPVSA
jgi:hypothetical protein